MLCYFFLAFTIQLNVQGTVFAGHLRTLTSGNWSSPLVKSNTTSSALISSSHHQTSCQCILKQGGSPDFSLMRCNDWIKHMTPHKYLCSATQTFLPLSSLGRETLSESPSKSVARRLNNATALYPRPVMSPKDGLDCPPAMRAASNALRQSQSVTGKFLCRRSALSAALKCSCVFANNCYCPLWLHNASLLFGTASLRQDWGSLLEQQETATVW